MNLISIYPFTRILDNWVIQDRHILQKVCVSPTDQFINFHEEVKLADVTRSNDPVLQQSAFLHVITCTVFNYPHVFTSEKNFKPIINMRPFILVSSPGSLRNMKQLGFKTFDKYWSEEYDSILDPTERIITIVDLIKQICNKPVHELKDMCVDMHDILTYNRNYYYNDFISIEKNKFEAQCQRNLGVR